jgi:hypothetical protein
MIGRAEMKFTDRSTRAGSGEERTLHRKEQSMDEDLNVGNLSETRAERAPATQTPAAMLPPRRKDKQSSPMTAWVVAAVAVAFAIIVISAKRGKRVHVMERY